MYGNRLSSATAPACAAAGVRPPHGTPLARHGDPQTAELRINENRESHSINATAYFFACAVAQCHPKRIRLPTRDPHRRGQNLYLAISLVPGTLGCTLLLAGCFLLA